MKKISIIVAVYNVEIYLQDCIESLMQQTYSNIEILLIDDGSTDKSGLICDQYREKDARIFVFHKENGGASSARNVGLQYATGELIGFVDGDDWVEPDIYANLCKWIELHNVSMAACGWYIYDESADSEFSARDQEPIMVHNSEKALMLALSGRDFEGYLWNKLFDADFFKKKVGSIKLNDNIHVCEDLLLVCQCLDCNGSIYYNATPLYHYRIRSSSILHSTGAHRASELLARELILDAVKKYGGALMELAQCRLGDLAAQIYADAVIKKNVGIIKQTKQIAKKYKQIYLRSNQCTAYEKVRYLCRLYAPVLSNNIKVRIATLSCK